MTQNKALMAEARQALEGRWGVAVGASALYLAISIALGVFDELGSVASLLIEGPLILGLALFYLDLARKQPVDVSQVFSGFNDFPRAFVAYLLMGIFVILWSLLLIVPGIIAAIAYSQTYFILVENKDLSALDAIRKSKQMMLGHKKKFFFLSLRFLGWFLLSVLTLGIGFLWSIPYFWVTMAKFYDDIKTPAEPAK